MTNKKRVIIIIIILAFSIFSIMLAQYATRLEVSGTITPDIPQKMQQIETVPNNQLSNDNTITNTCQQPSNNLYGGIGRSENNPPDGTVIDKELTKYYGRLTATGVCGTYQYISGWWFSDEEMGRLPPKSLMYGESPYVTDEGSDMQGPIAPVPESSTLILVTFGIFTIMMLKKYKNK